MEERTATDNRFCHLTGPLVFKKRGNMKKLNIFVFSALGLLSQSAFGQDYSMPVYIGSWDLGVSATSETILSNAINDEANEATNNEGRADAVNTNSVSYTPSRSHTKVILANFIAKTRASDPSAADKIEGWFAKGDIIDKFEVIMQGKA
jgi:hypothetical protein